MIPNLEEKDVNNIDLMFETLLTQNVMNKFLIGKPNVCIKDYMKNTFFLAILFLYELLVLWELLY